MISVNSAENAGQITIFFLEMQAVIKLSLTNLGKPDLISENCVKPHL